MICADEIAVPFYFNFNAENIFLMDLVLFIFNVVYFRYDINVVVVYLYLNVRASIYLDLVCRICTVSFFAKGGDFVKIMVIVYFLAGLCCTVWLSASRIFTIP